MAPLSDFSKVATIVWRLFDSPLMLSKLYVMSIWLSRSIKPCSKILFQRARHHQFSQWNQFVNLGYIIQYSMHRLTKLACLLRRKKFLTINLNLTKKRYFLFRIPFSVFQWTFLPFVSHCAMVTYIQPRLCFQAKRLEKFLLESVPIYIKLFSSVWVETNLSASWMPSVFRLQHQGSNAMQPFHLRRTKSRPGWVWMPRANTGCTHRMQQTCWTKTRGGAVPKRTGTFRV